MIVTAGAVCPFCRASMLSGLRRPLLRQPTWHSSQAASRAPVSQLQKRRPSRMELSRTVAKPPTAIPSGRGGADAKPKGKQPSPFGNLNRTHVGMQLQAQKQRDEEKSNTRSAARDRKKMKTSRDVGQMKALKMQRALQEIPYAQRSRVKRNISDIDSFEDFPLLPSVREAIEVAALPGQADISPTPIQKLAIPALLGVQTRRGGRQSSNEMKQFLLAAETGSGKTLAYLLPTLDAIKRAEVEESKREEAEGALEPSRRTPGKYEIEAPPLPKEPHPTTGRPRAIVLVPTSELVEQVGSLFKAFSHHVKLRVSLISASYSGTIIRNRLFSPNGIDVVVSTPHLLGNIAESEPNILSRVTHLVIDEADSLFDRSFAPLTSNILDRATPSLQQLVLCSATIPRSLETRIQSRFPNIQRLATPNLHAIPRRVQLGVVDIEREPYRGNRDLACADAIWTIGRQAEEHGADGVKERAETKRVLVFVNEREKAQELAKYLVTKGIDAVALNRDTTENRRGEILSAFTSRDPPQGDQVPSQQRGDVKRTLQNTKVLVMTDLGSRGIDTINVRHVVLYDVPHTSIDFIHRLGRTGRMGRRGRGIVLVGKRDRKDVVREVREGMFTGKALI